MLDTLRNALFSLSGLDALILLAVVCLILCALIIHQDARHKAQEEQDYHEATRPPTGIVERRGALYGLPVMDVRALPEYYDDDQQEEELA